MDYLVPLLLCAFVCASSEPLGDALKKRRDVFGVYASGYDGYQPMRYAAIPLSDPIPVLHVLSPAPLAPRHKKPQDPMYAASMSYEMYARPYDAQPLATRPFGARVPYTSSHYYGSRPYSTQSFGASQTYSTRHPYSSQTFTQHPYAEPVSRRPWQQNYQDTEIRDSEIRGTRQPFPAEVYAPEPVTMRRPYSPDSYEVQEVYPRESYAEDTAPTVLYARPNKNGGYSYKRKPAKKRTVPKKLTKEDPVLIRIHKYRIIDD